MKKIMVNAADYEMYRFLLPWKFLFSREKKFILGELEKLHPRFSGSCCYDTKYSLHKQNLMAEVVVMEKANLARYKTAGGELFLENETKRSVFSGRAKILRILSILLILIAGLLSFRIAKSVLFEKNDFVVASEIPETIDVAQKTEENLEIPREAASVRGGEELLKEVFASVSLRGGKIASFSYKKNALPSKSKVSGECSFSIYGCTSEEVANAQYCIVSFLNNEPHFELLLPFEDTLFESEETAQKEKTDSEHDLVSISEVRKQLRDLGAVIESEHNGESEAEFSFVADSSKLYSCLKICGESAEKSLWQVKKFSVTESSGKCRVQTEFFKDGNTGPFNPILLCAQNAYLFASKLRIQPQKKKNLSASVAAKPIVVREKIGEMRKDGSIFICYRNIDGKMTFEKKEAVHE